MDALETLKQPVQRSREFLEECWAELKKVHWPTRQETQAATIAVVVGVLIVALYLGLVDFVLSWAMQNILPRL
ncbi:MAG: preprotein translocase subunit SecE [Candidatus Binatia bacterium]